MTSVNFQQWIQHPETLNRDTLYELRNLLARYPYFQSLRLLFLKNLYILHDISFGGELRKAVLYIADRRQLFRLIEGDRYDVQARKKGVPLTEVLKDEPSVDRTLALIDALALFYKVVNQFVAFEFGRFFGRLFRGRSLLQKIRGVIHRIVEAGAGSHFFGGCGQESVDQC